MFPCAFFAHFVSNSRVSSRLTRLAYANAARARNSCLAREKVAAETKVPLVAPVRSGRSGLKARNQVAFMYGNRERAVALTLLLLNATAAAFAKGPKIAPDAQNISAENVNSDGTVDLVVQFNSPVQKQQMDVVSRHGGKAKKVLPGLGGGAFRVPRSAI